MVLGCAQGSPKPFAYGAITLCGRSFHIVQLGLGFVTPPAVHDLPMCVPLPPAYNARGLSRMRSLGYSRFARHYLGNRICFLFLRVLRWFSSPGSPRLGYFFTRAMSRLSPGRVAPFGDPRIYACLQLPEAYRSLPRPSSPPDAKASTLRP